MAKRPVFIPISNPDHLVNEKEFEFKWNPGFAPVQKKKNIAALHESAKAFGLYPILEVSSKSDEAIGQRLSAFSLQINSTSQVKYNRFRYENAGTQKAGILWYIMDDKFYVKGYHVKLAAVWNILFKRKNNAAIVLIMEKNIKSKNKINSTDSLQNFSKDIYPVLKSFFQNNLS